MRATLTDDQQALDRVAADLAASGRPDHPRAHERIPEASTTTRNLMEGFAGLAVPESAGGAGGGLVDLALVVHQLGRHLVSSPFVPHVAAMQAAVAADLDVSAAAAGSQVWTLAAQEPGTGPTGPWSDAPSARTRVPYGSTADAIVACVGTEDVAVMTGATAHNEDAFDLGRPSATVTLDGETAARASGAAAGLRRAWTVQAAELVGVGRGAVELAAAYANEREQFGQPIGRFQGVAHQLADALVAVENAWSLVLYAAWAVDADAADATKAVHLAAGSAGEAAVFAAEKGTQVHGGIGITWEALPHLYLRRALAGATAVGEPAWHRIEAAQALLAS